MTNPVPGAAARGAESQPNNTRAWTGKPRNAAIVKGDGVADGSRTRYLRSHNPVLYLVSYSHHQE